MFKGVVGWIIAAGAALCLLAVAGCGSSGDETLSKAEFEKQAASICKEAEAKRGKIIASLIEKIDPKGDVQAQQAELVTKAMPTYEEAAQQINDLGSPEGQEKKAEALVEAMEDAADKSNADPHTAATSNIFFRKADQLAKEFKLSGCVI
jgi:hypothetical protein